MGADRYSRRAIMSKRRTKKSKSGKNECHAIDDDRARPRSTLNNLLYRSGQSNTIPGSWIRLICWIVVAHWKLMLHCKVFAIHYLISSVQFDDRIVDLQLNIAKHLLIIKLTISIWNASERCCLHTVQCTKKYDANWMSIYSLLFGWQMLIAISMRRTTVKTDKVCLWPSVCASSSHRRYIGFNW